jgi:subfamily B ATP-binding cassette protein MsbA
LLSVSLRFFSTTKVGDLINTLTSEVSRARHLFTVVTGAITQLILLVTYLAVIVLLSWQLALLTLGLCVFIFAVVNPLMHRLLFEGSVISAANSRFTSVASEMIGGIRTIAAFGAQDFERTKFEAASQDAADANVSATRQSARVGPMSQGIGSTALIGMVIVGVQYFVLPGQMSMARLIAFIVALMRLLPLARSLNDARAQHGVVKGALDKVTTLIQDNDKPYLTYGDRTLDRFRSAIELRNVWFAYEPGTPVLKDINLTIEKGKITAFVGSSGAGKSTLADLVARFYDPNQGQVLIDGVDLREYTRDSLRSQMAIVNQDTFLFNDTVRANIAYGLENVSEEALRDAAQKANALEFIEEMENGFDTELGDRGARLSGGQRQRIAIARAILRNPEILILDEATSALDSKSERLIQESLEYLMDGRTVISIAHRLSTIENADKVVVLEQGRVVEEGEYHELLSSEGSLWEFHRLQQFQTA